jgi:hypothetical protein
VIAKTTADLNYRGDSRTKTFATGTVYDELRGFNTVVKVDNVLMTLNTDYTYANNAITFTVAPNAGAKITIVSGRVIISAVNKHGGYQPFGSGKSVLAARLWSALVTEPAVDGNVVFVSTSASQKSNWTSIFEDVSRKASGKGIGRGAVIPANQFNPGLTPAWVAEQAKRGRKVTIESWRENLALFRKLSRKGLRLEDDDIAVSIVDEAHALIDPTVQGKRGVPPSGWSMHAGPQAWHVIRASRVSIFLMDSRQSYRDNETTTVESLRSYAREQGAVLGPPVDLSGSQFRCGGSAEYIAWLDGLLSTDDNWVPETKWRHGAANEKGAFDFELVDTPFELEANLRARLAEGRSARIVAAYGRPWKTKPPKDAPRLSPHDQMAYDFDLPCIVDDKPRRWQRVWNYAPDQDYSLWVQAPPDTKMAEDPLGPYVITAPAGVYSSAPWATKASDWAAMPSAAWRSASARTSWVMFMLQNFGPHMLQKWATLAPSAGRVWSWNSLAFSGSSESANWSSQRNSKRALDRALSRIWAPGCPFARSAAWAAIL